MKQVQISHDIVQLVTVQYRAHAHPVTLVVFFRVAKKKGKRFSWIINHFGAKYCRIFLQLVKYTVILHTKKTNKIYILRVYPKIP